MDPGPSHPMYGTMNYGAHHLVLGIPEPFPTHHAPQVVLRDPRQAISPEGHPAPYLLPGSRSAQPVIINQDLETFREDVYAAAGYENAPIAQQIFHLLQVYIQLKGEGRLYATPPSILPASSQLVPPGLPTRNDTHPDAAVEPYQEGVHGQLCKWRGCGRPIGSAASDVKTHLLSYHGCDITEPPEAWRSSDAKLRCRWSECDSEPLLIRSLPKHICGTHLKSNTTMCPVEGCNERLSRGDALKRHMELKHRE